MLDDAEGLRSCLAKALLDYISRSVEPTYAKIDAACADGDCDVIDLSIEAQLPQDRVVSIENVEAIRIIFAKDDSESPLVLARRADFPIDLVHTNLAAGADGKCLCIWEENWHDLSRGLTPEDLVERIRNWLSKTAVGEIHQGGQPLEPLISQASSTLIVPSGAPPDCWYFKYLDVQNEVWTAIVDGEPPVDGKRELRLPLFSIKLSPQVHRALQRRPHDLEALRLLVEGFGGDLLDSLGDWLTRDEQLKAHERRPLLVISVPMKRSVKAEPESSETWAFMSGSTLGELGEALGRTCVSSDVMQSIPRIPRGAASNLSEVALVGWRVISRLDRSAARRFASSPATQDRSLVAVGAGAIGSNVIINTIRAGIGTWTIIDDDIVLPHNTLRQVHNNRAVGFPKAETTAYLANSILAEQGCSFVIADVLAAHDKKDAIARAFADSDLVVDFSASPAVLGRISDDATVKRAASLFLNPEDSDLVVLAEDQERAVRLDEIEAQYYLSAACGRGMEGHLESARLDLVRYANACQDLSRPVPPWQVQTLCGIAGGRLLSLLEKPGSVAFVWRIHLPTGGVIPVALPVTSVHRRNFSGWRFSITSEVIETTRKLRKKAAPSETGGILLGTFDNVRHVVHVIAALPAPPDSKQAPTYFIRGSKDLKPFVEGVAARSAGAIHYVGEWHSHPDSVAARPSGDDENVFRHLRDYLAPSGAPYVIVICGKEEVWLRAGWQRRPTEEVTIPHDRK